MMISPDFLFFFVDGYMRLVAIISTRLFTMSKNDNIHQQEMIKRRQHHVLHAVRRKMEAAEKAKAKPVGMY